MKRLARRFLLLSALAMPALAHAAEVQVPPVAIRERTLANGLHVYAVLDRSTPDVGVQMWYGVGAKNDPAGRSGFAHLFEHLMFKATRDMPSEFLDRLTEDVGGFNNASTDDDYTDYYEVVPANHLERILWAEAERLSGLVVDEANFHSERSVVEEELRQRVLADPYGRLTTLAIPEASFEVHPYHRPSIGGIADLEAASLADVRAFHAVYYRPDDASLIVVGDFDPAQLDAWVDRYFGPIARPAWPMPRVTAVEPPRTHPRAIDVYGPDVPLPAVVMTWPAPAATSPDAPALQVLDAVLTTGDSSRLYQALVYRQRLAQSVFSDADLRQQPGLFDIGAVLAEGKTPAAGVAAIDAEIVRLKTTVVSPAALEAAKNQLIAGVLENRETVDGLGSELGEAITVEGDANRVNTDVAELEAVSAEDVRRVARVWLADRRRVLIRYRAERERPHGEADVLVQDTPKLAAAPLAAPPDVPVVQALSAGERQAPPPPGPPVPVRFAAPIEQALPNGLRVVVARTGSTPIVTAELTVLSGAATDGPGRAGLTALTANLLTQGTTSRSAGEIATAVERQGDSLAASTGYDETDVSLTGLSATLPAALPILAEVVSHPAFALAEFARQRQEMMDNLDVTLSDPGALAERVMARAVFADGPYGGPTDGTASALRRIGRADVLAQYRRLFRPDNAVLILTGDIEPAAGFALARQAFGDWAKPDAPPPAPPSAGAPSPPRVVVVDLPGAGQAAVAVGGRSLARADPAFYAAEVANGLLGGGYSARLNEAIRIKRGLSYGAGSELRERRAASAFYASAQTRNDAADEVAGLMLDEVRGLAADPPSAGEVAAREAALTGDFGRSAATSLGLAGYISHYAASGVDPGEIGRYAAEIDAISADQAAAATARLVDPDALSVVVVGDAKAFLPALKARFPHLEVVEAGALDLDEASLGERR